MPDEQDIKIAVLEREIIGLREQQRIYRGEIAHSMREIAHHLSEGVKELRGDIKNIYEFVNRSRGSTAVLLMLASMLGSMLVTVGSWALAHLTR